MLFVNGILISLAIVVISYFLWYCCHKVFFIRRLNNLPGPRTLPFIGNFHILLGREEFVNLLLKMSEDYSSPLQFWLGSKLFIGIYEPDDAKTILHSRNCIEKSMIYKIVPLLGMGLITAPASLWTRIRKLAAPTFNSYMLRNFFDVFVQQSIIFTHKLEKDGYLNGKEIILLEQISNCAWKIACDSIMGIQLEPNKNNDYLKAVQRY
ncbi:cytochrome P450 4C1-like [Temnothorax curvispinosus]|uniref:Cytochrome P450 4C1-like n=1 Tax=Temnothorax curvispinosus TaxID=300111 RepID=A0A6J1PY85_9HYME|nr:cytochrome P450 4C1-like [Temnothorax curvispinosus]